MGLYIKGIEMPEICDMCPLLAFIEEEEDHDAFCYCRLSNWKKSCTPDPMTIREVRRFRRLDCPLVEVKPHGRLIDADAVAQDLDFDIENDQRALDQMDFVGKERKHIQFDKDCKQNCIRYLSEASTVIPAEEGE